MQGFRLPSTIYNIARLRGGPSLRDNVQTGPEQPSPVEVDESTANDINEEFKLPKMASLVIIILSNVMLQITFFIVVSSSNDYAQHLGGSSTFSGLVIGIPTAISGITLLPLMRFDQGVYARPLHFACASMVIGNMLYGLAYRANWLYLILLGRIVCGGGFTFWMYTKRYCSDPRIVGVRRRTTLAGWLVLGQGVGFSLGPFVGGLLFKVGFNNSVFNGYTSPAWIMAALWAVFWALVAVFYEDVPRTAPASIALRSIPAPSNTPSATPSVIAKPSANDMPKEAAALRVAVTGAEVSQESPSGGSTTSHSHPDSNGHGLPTHIMTPAQWGVAATMCWFAMTSFFILGAWESNIPVFTASHAPANPFHFSPFAAGNLIALGGACTIPFLLLNLHVARRVQDRHTLAAGTAVGSAGLVVALAILGAERVEYGSLFVCWFLVALGFNVASTVTLSLLSKQLPGEWNGRISLFIQWSNYTGRVTGAVWGGAGVKVGMLGYVGLQMGWVGIGTIMFVTLWRHLKAKTG